MAVKIKLLVLLMSFILGSTLRADSGLEQLVADGCMEPLFAKLSVFEASCMPNNDGDYLKMTIPKRIIDWGSGGKGGHPWQFNEARCNEFFLKLPRQIEKLVPTVRQSPHDLFHAHLLVFGDKSEALAAVFHAKEYPRDFEEVKNYYQIKGESFVSTEQSFKARNFIYLSAPLGPKVPSDLYVLNNRGACHKFFADYALNTLSEQKLARHLNGQIVGDVNMFNIVDIGRIKYNNYQNIESDEKYSTSKEFNERRMINKGLDRFILGSKTRNIVYFLTGLAS